MTQKFPFHHFLKLDGSTEPLTSSKATPAHPVIIEKAIKAVMPSEAKLINEFSSEELKTITEELLENIKNLMNSSKFHAYFSNTMTVSEIKHDVVELVVTTTFIKKMIETHYGDLVRQSIFQILGKSYQIEIQVMGQAGTTLSSNNENILNTLKPKKPDSVKTSTFFIEDLGPTQDDLLKTIDSKVIEHHQSSGFTHQVDLNKTFENFVIGPSNNIAHALSMAVAKEPGKTYPALYVYGNSGLGKTHLIHAIANYIQSHKPSMRITMTSANRFMDEMINSMKNQKQSEFKQKYIEKTDVLIIDDIHELKDRTGTQNQFFTVFNELMDRGKQLVFTSDKPPKEIDGIEERIRTRLSSALPVEVQQPDLETRIAILKRKAVERDIYLGDDVVNLIAKCVKSNIRELEGCLVKLGAVTSLLKVDIDLEVAKEHLKLSEEIENQKNVTIESIAKTVSHYYKIPIGDMRGKAKTKDVAGARQVAMYLINKMIKPTLKENGHYFSNRDHSTVLHAVDSIKGRIKVESLLAQQVLDIEKQL
jgi:chromosomal replication initiator protein